MKAVLRTISFQHAENEAYTCASCVHILCCHRQLCVCVCVCGLVCVCVCVGLCVTALTQIFCMLAPTLSIVRMELSRKSRQSNTFGHWDQQVLLLVTTETGW